MEENIEKGTQIILQLLFYNCDIIEYVVEKNCGYMYNPRTTQLKDKC